MKKNRKTLKNKKFSSVNNVLIAVYSTMENVQTKGKTTLEVNNLKTNIKIKENVIGFQGLKSL